MLGAQREFVAPLRMGAGIHLETRHMRRMAARSQDAIQRLRMGTGMDLVRRAPTLLEVGRLLRVQHSDAARTSVATDLPGMGLARSAIAGWLSIISTALDSMAD